MARKNLLKGFKRPKGITYEQSESGSDYGKFLAYPFEPGYGTTVGNTLRRILLSSIQGYAVTAVRIVRYDAEGSQHIVTSEFETIPGVVEDTIEVLNNLKQVRLRLPDDEEQATFLYELKGPGEITGGTFAKDKPVEVLNPGIKIATLMEDAHLDLEIQVDLGRGYVPSEVNEKYVEVVGTIPMDAIFSPVNRVKYQVEPTRVGQRSDYDKLVLEIWTDGTVKPEDALAEAAKIAKDHFAIFVNFDEGDSSGDEENDEIEERGHHVADGGLAMGRHHVELVESDLMLHRSLPSS
ncbi:MAG TPA: DNA-directed RNA polymerase subunit alpha, partial [Methanomassiliicoccales archaeon]|nr:DNA-directed RNA polymerase subunit alpha [Methanomassiliicoccales archaeon]